MKRERERFMNSRLPHILTVLAWAALAVFLAVFFYRPIETEDVWWHLAAGRWIVEHGQVPQHDVFSFTANPVAWTFTQWLGSTTLYAVFAAGGHEALKVVRVLLGIAPLFIFALYARRKLPAWLLIPVVALMAFGIGHYLPARPLMFNLAFASAFLVWLFDFERTGRRRNLVCLLLAGALWGNLHLGGFAYGITLVAIFWAATLVRWIMTRPPARTSGKQLRRLSVTIALYIASLAISPYGFDALMYPFKVFLIPSFINFYQFRFIDETMPPYYLLSPQGAWFFVLTGLLLFGLFVNCTLTRVLLCVVSFLLMLFMQRNEFFFTLIAGFVIVECLGHQAKEARAFLSVTARDIAVLMGLLVILFAGMSVYQLNRKAFVDGETQQVIAAQEEPGYFNIAGILAVIRENRLTGNVFNSDIFGGYLLWHAYPGLKPIADGRQLDKEMFGWYMKVSIDPERYWAEAQAQFKFDIAIINSIAVSQKKVAAYLNRQPDWQLIALEGSNLLFVRRGVFDLPQHLNAFGERLAAVPVNPADLNALYDFIGSRHPVSLNKYLDPPPDYIDAYDEGQALFALGYRGAGVRSLKEASELNDDVNIRRAALHVLQFMNLSTVLP
jgi:hypothetical protein